MIVQNMPGGGGVQGVQNLYNVSRNDGTAVGTTPGGPLKEPLMGDQRVNYDLRQFGWIGSLVGVDDTACVVWGTSPIKSWRDARDRTVTLSATGSESNSTLGPLLLNDLLGTRFKPISGYDGGTAMLAVERGEVDGRCVTLNSIRATHPDWLNKKLVRILLTMSEGHDPIEAGVPAVTDLLTTKVEKSAFKFFQGPDEIQEPFMLPPRTAPDIVRVYRQAFRDAVNDPGYRTDAKKRRQFIAPRSGDETASVIQVMYATPADVIQRVKGATSLTKPASEK
jgi:tripartite-type tricarboxylate transporter receptor subunit TctC